MKLFVVIALIATMASAAIIKPTVVSELAQIHEIVAAIHSPSTDPATAAALEQMLLDVLGLGPGAADVEIGPAIIEHQPIEVGPINPVKPEPVAVPAPVVESAGAPLVQLIVNVNAGASPVAPGPVSEPAPIGAWEVPEGHEDDKPWPIQIVDSAPEHDDEPWPINIVESAPEVAPVEPVIIGTPVIPAPAVNLPEELN